MEKRLLTTFIFVSCTLLIIFLFFFHFFFTFDSQLFPLAFAYRIPINSGRQPSLLSFFAFKRACHSAYASRG